MFAGLKITRRGRIVRSIVLLVAGAAVVFGAISAGLFFHPYSVHMTDAQYRTAQQNEQALLPH